LHQGNIIRLDIIYFKDYTNSVITRITGKNQVTVPAVIVEKAGLKAGTRLDWRTTDREGVLEVHVIPDNITLAAALRGRGSRFKRRDGSVVDRLHGERDLEENARTRP
jgi:bifunctional DNA-binding transcriptional regulator/antitoxin component of YhaV-PrlF toxin-antitoxin module